MTDTLTPVPEATAPAGTPFLVIDDDEVFAGTLARALTRRGYAVQPYATAYRANRIALDTNTLGDDVEISHAVQELVPTRGAVVRARFDVRRGQRMLVTVTRRNGSLLPIGLTGAGLAWLALRPRPRQAA